jgi:exoribonuclease R
MDSTIRHVGILELKSTVIYGTNKKNVKLYSISPWNKTLPKCIVPSKNKSNFNQIVIYKYKTLNEEKKILNGETQEILGDHHNDIILELGLIHYYNIPHPKTIQSMTITDYPRKNYLNHIVWSIDPVKCIDIDDCISYKLCDNYWKLYIHIADVTCHEYNNTCENRISSLYGKFKTYHLFKDDLLNQLSLLKNVERKAITLSFKINMSGELINFKYYRSLIKTSYNFDYDFINHVLFNNYNHKIKHHINECFNLCKNIKTSVNVTINDSHSWIEYIMILSNHYVAKQITNIPYRVQDKSNLISYPDSLPDLIKDKLNQKNMEAAKYSLENIGHSNLKLDYYTHFTSPIRRYIDQIIHKMLFNIPIQFDLDYINKTMSNIKKFHRQIDIWKLSDQIEDKYYEAIVINFNESKLELYIKEFNIIVKTRVFPKLVDHLINITNTDTSIKYEYNDNEIIFNIWNTINIKMLTDHSKYIPNQKFYIIIENTDWFSI